MRRKMLPQSPFDSALRLMTGGLLGCYCVEHGVTRFQPLIVVPFNFGTAEMPDWVIPLLVGSSGGGLAGYLLRGWIEDRFARVREARSLRQADIRALRDCLHEFLGQPRAHFVWLQDVRDVFSARGVPSPAEKANMIATWVYENAMKHPKERRGVMYLIANVAYQFARGDRHFLDASPDGYAVLDRAWNELDEYAQMLTRSLHDPNAPGGTG